MNACGDQMREQKLGWEPHLCLPACIELKASTKGMVGLARVNGPTDHKALTGPYVLGCSPPLQTPERVALLFR